METPVILVIGFAAVVTALAMAVRRRSIRRAVRVDATARPTSGLAPVDPPPGPRRLAPARIVVVGDRRPGARAQPGPDAPPVPVLGPRRRLVRDASAALFGIAAVILAASIVGTPPAPAGGVLSATGGPDAAATAVPTRLRTAIASPRAGASSRPDLAPAAPAVVSGADASSSPRAAPDPAQGSSARAVEAPGHTTPDGATPAVTRPAPTSVGGGVSTSHLALLSPCPGRSGCYLYVVRSGDTLSSIASLFGVPATTILRLNPTITDPSIVVRGSVLVLPTPTR